MSLQVVTSPPSSPRTPRGNVEIVERVPDQLAAEFLELYRAAFEPLARRSPARQWLTDEEFLHEMSNPLVLKFVGLSDVEPVALACMSTDISTVPWMSEPYFAHKFPEAYFSNSLYYFSSMLIRPERQGGPWAKYLLDHILHFLSERGGVGCFDCCGFNVDTVALPDLIQRAGRRYARCEVEVLDRQEYYSLVVDGFQ